MRTITTIGVIIIGIGILFYVTQESISMHAIPSLQEYITLTTSSSTSTGDNQASVAWLASSTIVDSLLVHDSATSSNTKNVSYTNSTKIIQTIPKSTSVSKKITPIASTTPTVKNNSLLTPVKTSKGTLYVTVAKNPTTRERGLSGYASLDIDKGMLFIFPTSNKPYFWMKDMNFPLDIVWINSDRKIVGVSSNISPETYPKTFSSPSKIQFVLEVNAGFAEKFGLATGTRVVF